MANLLSPRKFRATKLLVVLLFLVSLNTSLVRPSAAGDSKKQEVRLLVPSVFDKVTPESVEELKAIQEHVKLLIDKVMPATVNLKVGPGQGSGVIISEDGYVLTAAHVIFDKKGKKSYAKCTVTLRDGKVVEGKPLDVNNNIDSGLVKITTPGKYPFVSMGESGKLKKSQWVLATGHPGGWKDGRAPVVRLGRVIDNGKSAIRSDCTLVGGDSGGPLFDMQGQVIGIHSRIQGNITQNIHVPVDTYRDNWDHLAMLKPYLGIQTDQDANDCKVVGLTGGSPAEKAGIKIDDIVMKFGDKNVDNL